MGLCKCPKKKVTNLFCFEHRVNVCEHCLVANHNKCIVQSYLQWLQDSDYSPLCSLCNKDLSDETCGECIRLTCYDVFHLACIHQYARALPANTAPAGYTCPKCHAGIFPPSHMASPVADQLRETLTKLNWARAGLGLPLIEEKDPVLTVSPPAPTQNGGVPGSADITVASSSIQTSVTPPPSAQLATLTTLGVTPSTTRPSAQVSPYTSTPTRPQSGVHSVINVDEGTSVRGLDKQAVADPRKLFDSTKEDLLNLSHDHDDDKYRRRPAMDWLNRWLRSRDTGPKRGMMKKEPTTVRRKFLIVLLIGVIGFLTLIVIFSKLGRSEADDDPFLDPMANPNIRVNES